MRVIMTGGGTGGHIYPAIAIAEKIRRKHPDAEILFIGAEGGQEKDRVPDAGYDIKLIPVRGFYRKYIWKNFGVIYDLLRSCGKAKEIIKKFKPDLVIGTGGYVCGPVVMEAHRLKIPAYLHEQNVRPGFTNKLAEKFADKIFVGFKEGEDYFKDKSKVIYTGNPVRKAFITSTIVDHRAGLGISENDFVILCFGGSGGSRKINDTILAMLGKISDMSGMRLFFITGKKDHERVMGRVGDMDIDPDKITILEYVDNMHEYLTAADIVVARSGAITIAEITVSGKPSILIPSSNVVHDHQYYNAKSVAENGGAVIIRDEELEPGKLLDTILKLKNNKELLNRMAAASSRMGRADAVDLIYDHLDIRGK